MAPTVVRVRDDWGQQPTTNHRLERVGRKTTIPHDMPKTMIWLGGWGNLLLWGGSGGSSRGGWHHSSWWIRCELWTLRWSLPPKQNKSFTTIPLVGTLWRVLGGEIEILHPSADQFWPIPLGGREVREWLGLGHMCLNLTSTICVRAGDGWVIFHPGTAGPPNHRPQKTYIPCMQHQLNINTFVGPVLYLQEKGMDFS